MRDVQSIQIERGSSSAGYGSSAFAGVVNITTGQPSPKPVHLFGGLEWTSFHGLRFNQGVSGTIQDRSHAAWWKIYLLFQRRARITAKGYGSLRVAVDLL